MIRTVLAAAAVAAGVTAVVAQSDPLSQRKSLMKGNGQHLGAINRMVRGEDPFDVTKINAAFAQWSETAEGSGPVPGAAETRRGVARATQDLGKQERLRSQVRQLPQGCERQQGQGQDAGRAQGSGAARQQSVRRLSRAISPSAAGTTARALNRRVRFV